MNQELFIAALKRNADAVLLRASSDLAAGNAESAAGVIINKFITPAALAYVLTTVPFGDAATLQGSTLQNIIDGYTSHVASQIATSEAALQTYIDSAIDGLVEGAPTTLDTLNKLAAALGDDPAFSTTITTLINNHVADNANPHGVTKAQVGLGSVSNYGIASQASAEEGTLNTAYMTPLRVAQAIVVQGGNQFLGKTAQAADSALLGGQTLAQVIASAQAGNAATATRLQTTRSISISGDGSATGNFDGSANLTLALVLANSGVTAGQYTKLTVDAKGRVTAGTTLAATDIPALDTGKLTTGTLPLSRGGTGGTDQASARSSLGIGSMATRNVTISTAAPSGGADGDIWLQYS